MVRQKKRYMVVEIHPQKPSKTGELAIDGYKLHLAILDKIQQLHGDFGVAATTAHFGTKYCNAKTRIAIIRVRHGPHRFVASVLPYVTMVDNKWVSVNTLYTGATIRQCFKFILNYQQQKVEQLCAALKTEEEKDAVKRDLLNFSAENF